LRDLDRAMGELSEEQRQVILLVGLEAMSYEEVATILDLPVGRPSGNAYRVGDNGYGSWWEMRRELARKLTQKSANSSPRLP
jgi:Sigma-70, region 4